MSVTFGDSAKAIFGAGSDLQIFSEGSGGNSFISEEGSGTLFIQGTDLRFRSGQTPKENFITAIADGAVTLYHNNAEKLATTATGIDVTGTATMDGLTVDGTISAYRAGFTQGVQLLGDSGGNQIIGTATNDKKLIIKNQAATQGIELVSGNKAINIAHNGDISFYEDTGTTPKLVWKSADERLGIGTSSPSHALHINTTATAGRQNLEAIDKTSQNLIKVTNPQYATDASAGMVFRVFPDSDARQGAGILASGGGSNNSTDISLFVTDASAVSYAPYRIAGQDGTHTFYTAPNTERMRIDASGNLLVGATSSNYAAVGSQLGTGGNNYMTRSGAQPLLLNRLSSDGDILAFYKDGTTVGSISNSGTALIIGSADTALLFDSSANQIKPRNTSGASRDAAIDLGANGHRFKDLYLSGGVYLGGTGAANKLDDYEEGTWTPRLLAQLQATSRIIRNSNYTKIGTCSNCTYLLLQHSYWRFWPSFTLVAYLLQSVARLWAVVRLTLTGVRSSLCMAQSGTNQILLYKDATTIYVSELTNFSKW